MKIEEKLKRLLEASKSNPSNSKPPKLKLEDLDITDPRQLDYAISGIESLLGGLKTAKKMKEAIKNPDYYSNPRGEQLNIPALKILSSGFDSMTKFGIKTAIDLNAVLDDMDLDTLKEVTKTI